MSINKLLNQLKNDHSISATISYKGKNYIFRQPLKKINKKRLITLFLILIILTFIFLLDLMQLKEIKTSKMSLININRDIIKSCVLGHIRSVRKEGVTYAKLFI